MGESKRPRTRLGRGWRHRFETGNDGLNGEQLCILGTASNAIDRFVDRERFRLSRCQLGYLIVSRADLPSIPSCDGVVKLAGSGLMWQAAGHEKGV